MSGTNRCCRTLWVWGLGFWHPVVFRTIGHTKIAKARLIRMWWFGEPKMLLLYPSTNFRQVLRRIGTRESPQYKPSFFEINPTVGFPSISVLPISTSRQFQRPGARKMHIFWEPGSWKVPIGNSQSPRPEHAWYSLSHLGWHFRKLFQNSKLKARKSLVSRYSEKRRSSFELWALQLPSKISPQMGLAVQMIRWKHQFQTWKSLSYEKILIPGTIEWKWSHWRCWTVLPCLIVSQPLVGLRT